MTDSQPENKPIKFSYYINTPHLTNEGLTLRYCGEQNLIGLFSVSKQI